MDGPVNENGAGDEAMFGVLRAERIELFDDEGTPRLVLGKLGEGDDDVYGISVHATEGTTGVYLTADGASAGLALSRRGDGVLDCRVFGRVGEPAAAVDLGLPGGALVSVDVAEDGSVTVSFRGDVRVVPPSPPAPA